MLPAEFQFLRPWWLLAFIPLLGLSILAYVQQAASRKWEAVIDRSLLPHILIGNEAVTRRSSALLTFVCGTLAILALAGPVWNKLPQPVFSTQSALVIALDLSRSMNAADITPSRLERARFKVADLLETRAEGETAMMVYAGDAFTVTPLTDDTATIESQLMALTTDIMPEQGNRTDIAVSNAVGLLQQAGVPRGDILLITDEVDNVRAMAAVADLVAAGYRLSILGVGTPQGAPITLADGSFFKDPSGQIVVPKLSEEPMRELASAGGGHYVRMTTDETDINELVTFMSRLPADEEVAATGFETDVWQEQGPWLLLPLLPLAALLFRRGILVVLVLLCLPMPQPAQALDWDALWLRPDQRAEQRLREGDATAAASLFKDPAWRGVARYEAEAYDDALEDLQDLEGVENRYNFGNALARKGRYEEAIQAYNEVLAADPDHEDARYNKELLEKELEQQEQEQEQQSPEEQVEQDSEQQQEQQQPDQEQPDQQPQDRQQQQEQEEQEERDRHQQEEQERQERERQEQQRQQQEQQREPEEQPAEPQDSGEEPVDEEQQATEQWLRRIPDDPGGLLRRKFLYQSQQRQRDRIPGEKQW